MTPEHPDYHRLKLHQSDLAHRPPTPPTRTWLTRNWGRINLIVIAALLLFVMGSTMCRA